MTRIAINGFGRIGRIFFSQIAGHKDLQVVAINDLGDLENLAYLLKYDTVYGKCDKKVDVKGGKLVVDGEVIEYLQIKELKAIPWGKLGVDIVIESTGAFESFAKAKDHLAAGAKRVIIAAPSKDADDDPAGGNGKTILVGLNDGDFKKTVLTSNASCTTNGVSPVIQVMDETVGVKKAILNTVHAYTATQNIVDGPTKGKDFRRGRAGAQNIVPSFTGAAIAVTRVLKNLEGKFDGIAMRVPVPSGSIADITFVSKKKTSVEEVNNIFKNAAKEKRWQGILKVTDDQLVSSDIIGEPYGAIVDLNFTKVVDGDLVKVLSWYDNEWGYVSTLVRHVQEVAKLI